MFTQVVSVVNIQARDMPVLKRRWLSMGPKVTTQSQRTDFITLTPPEIDGPDMRDPLEGKTRGKDMGNANVLGSA